MSVSDQTLGLPAFHFKNRFPLKIFPFSRATCFLSWPLPERKKGSALVDIDIGFHNLGQLLIGEAGGVEAEVIVG